MFAFSFNKILDNGKVEWKNSHLLKKKSEKKTESSIKTFKLLMNQNH